jgi:ribosomal-protein-alanine N-acetyltransferase
MALLKPSLMFEPSPVLRAGSIALRVPVMSDFERWAELRGASRHHLVPFEPQWSSDELSRSAFRERIRRYHRDMKDDYGYAFFMVRPADDAILGGITLSNVRRGVTQAATVGYWVGAPFVRRGYASSALGAVVTYAIETLRLHRIEAASMPANAPSLGVLDKAGFQREGLARKYLKINGLWEDHVLLARVAHDPMEQRPR